MGGKCVTTAPPWPSEMSLIWQQKIFWQSHGHRSHQGCTFRLPNQCLYQVSTSYTWLVPRYSPHKILKVKVTTAWTKKSNKGHTLTSHTYTPQPMFLPSVNILHFTVSIYSPDKILKVKVWSKVKSRSCHDAEPQTSLLPLGGERAHNDKENHKVSRSNGW